MGFEAIENDQAVRALYRAAAGQERFETALGLMMEPLKELTLGAQMIGLDPVAGGLTFSYANLSTPVEAEADLEYMRKYHTVDPRIPILVKREPRKWLWCQDEFSEDRKLEESYYRDLLVPVGGNHSGTCKMLESEREMAFIGVFSRLGGRGFTPDMRRYLERMGEHLSEALSIHRHVKRLASASAVGLELIERLNKPAWVVGEARELIGANALGNAVIAAATPFRESAGRLTAFAPTADNLVAAAVAGLMQRAEKEEAAPRTVLKLAGAGISAVVSISLFQPQQSLGLFGRERRFLVMLHAPRDLGEPDVYLWQVAFDLTPAEGRIAAAIYGGLSLREAAEHIGIRVSTANSQLDSVYAKTGTHGKVQLVRALQSLA